jgi:tRNA pseudouridine38-40 synthase
VSAADDGTRTFRLVLEYEGAGFEGWQIQAGARLARTVQGVLAEAVESVTGQTPRVRGAGRTDAGVHAQGQVASVHVETGLAPERLQAALNARLPDDVAVRALTEATPGWDALRAARGKHYRYLIWNGAQRSPLRAGTSWWVREALDLEAIEWAAWGFEGRHDFAAPRGEIRLDVEGEGFLRHMVRNLAGTLVEIGRGRWPAARAAEILASRDRGQAGPTAPAHGLCLIRVDDDGGGVPAGTHGGGEGAPVDSGGPVG